MRKGVDAAVTRAVAYIAKNQAKDGSFPTWVSLAPAPFVRHKTYATTFLPSLLLGSLHAVPGTEGVRSGLARWLLSQKTAAGSFNYWAKNSADGRRAPYPDDLDDTSCALIGLYLHDPNLVDATWLAQIVKLLVSSEQAVGGPYRTWLVSPDTPSAWHDTDLAVNSNIACLLKLVAEPLPNLTRLMDRAIATQTLTSPYYPEFYPLAYFVARAYAGTKARTLAAAIIKRRTSGHWGTPLQTALAISSLSQLGYTGSLQLARRYLLANQQTDGAWPAEAFWIDPGGGAQPQYCGSPSLTTALVLEALECCKPVSKHNKARATTNNSAAHIWLQARELLLPLDTALRSEALAMLDSMQKASLSQEIILLPLASAASLKTPPAAVTPDLLRALALANLFGWMAYTIYDDFLDNEGKPAKLSVANLALRLSIAQFRHALPGHAGYQAFVDRVLTTIDEANAWEVAHARCAVDGDTITIAALPRYRQRKRLAERSLGHALTPLAVLEMCGYPIGSAPSDALQQAFRHYLIARQLNDDLHDWEPDVRLGQCTYVVTAILQGLGTKPGAQSLSVLLPRMQQQFWHHTLPEVCAVMRVHIQKGKKALSACTPLSTPNALTTLFNDLEASVEHTLQEQKNAEHFLDAFRS